MASTVKQFGQLDVLVNNAGVHEGGDPAEITDEEWRKVKTQLDEANAESNRISKSIGQLMGQGKKEEAEEATRDPVARIPSLLEANDRLSKKLTQRDAKITELEARNGEGDAERVNGLLLEIAFLRECITTDEPISDLDTAWTLGHARG